MDRDLSCPKASVVAAIVGERPRDDGYEGSSGHWLVAKRLVTELGATPPDGGLPDWPDVPKNYKFPDSSQWIVDMAIRHVKETIPDDWALMVEVEFDYSFPRWRCTGHADVVAQSPCGKKLKSIDWKMGYIPVDDAEENDQVLTYLVLEKLDWPETEEAEFEIFQFRLPFDQRSTSTGKLTGKQLDRCVHELDRRVCESLEINELRTGLKQCKWCVGVSCPAIQALQKQMNLTLTPEILATIKATPDDATLADFVINGRTLKKPLEDATEMLHERLDERPTITAGCGMRISRKVQKGDISIPNPTLFREQVEIVLPERARQDKCITWSKTKLIDQIAEARDIKKTSKDDVSATSVYDAHLSPLTEQATKRILVIE